MTNPSEPGVIPDELVVYLTNRDRQRADEVQVFLERLTSRERWLVQEAAVMGWVLGARSVPGGWQQQVPRDPEIVASVIAHCQSTSDLYSVIGGDISSLVRKIVKQNEAPATDAVVRTVAELLRREEDGIAVVVQEMVADETLIESDGTLSLAYHG